jgi:predicted AAA+ superfamily ATPase
MIERTRQIQRVARLLRNNPAVAILGARQVGKTTLASDIAQTWPGPVHRFDLESPSDLARLAEPELALGRLTGLVVIDEIQRQPELFPVLRVLIDRDVERRFLILGSASRQLIEHTTETLAGRIAYVDLPPFTLDEVGAPQLDGLWIRGGFPRSFLADGDPASFEWRLNFIRTFIERDLPSLGVQVPATTTRRFWYMLAHVHGQVWNAQRFASSFGVSAPTVRRYLDTLTAALVVRQLLPWHANSAKRQVRQPKVFIADSGLLHALLDLADLTAVERHPTLGASWEGFVIEQIRAATGARDDQLFFWATHSGAELDVLWVNGGEKVGFEIKRTAAPRLTRSMRSAVETLGLDRAYVVHAGEHEFPLGEGVEAIPASKLAVWRP